jgi:carboxyl-terminal processing protease
MEDGYTVVASIVPGGAAAQDGRLKVNDKIIGVGQEEGEITDVVEMKLNRVVRLIRGPKGTQVRLQVKGAEGGEIKVYELERQTIELKSQEVSGEIMNIKDRISNGPDIRAGVIHIPSFYRDFEGARLGQNGFKSTARDVEAVLENFRQQGGTDVVIVDLRMNGGGALSEAIEVTGLFIDKGPVVQVKELDGEIKSHDDTDSGVAYSGPLVVLCNRLSASASEIFAGAIKDYGRGIVIGDTTTHGKGTVQNVMPVARQLFRFLGQEDRGALKLTINQFYRVNGDSTQSRGVPSDIVLPSLIDHWDLGESFLDNALEFDQIKPARHDAYGLVSADLISGLRKESQQRIAQDPKFAEIQKEIEKYLARKERKAISLNEETLRKEREEAKLTEEVEEKLLEQSQEQGPIFPDTPYNDEVLRISGDYAGLVKQLKTAQN